MLRRSILLIGGGEKASAEFRRMIAEKTEATIELQARLIGGTIGATRRQTTRSTVNHLRRKVRANRARLRR